MGIDIVRGTTKKILFTIYDDDGNIYKLKPGEKLILGVKKNENEYEYMLKKNITLANQQGDGYIISFSPQDTENLEFKNYWFDIGLQTGDDYYMVLEYSQFKVLKAITKREVIV